MYSGWQKWLPVVVIVHGGWSTPALYQDLINAIKRQGLVDVQCPQLPSMTNILPLPKTATFENDTATIRRTLESLADRGRAIVLLMHNYGGIVGGNCLDGLLWVQREADGERGGVVHLVYLTGFAPAPGHSLLTVSMGEVPPFTYENVEQGTVHQKDMRNSCYNHIKDDAEAQRYIDMMVHHPVSCLRARSTWVPYEYVGNGLDATYLVCLRDVEITVELQETMASFLGDARMMKYCDAGHFAMNGPYVDEIAEVVRQAWEVSKDRLGGT